MQSVQGLTRPARCGVCSAEHRPSSSHARTVGVTRTAATATKLCAKQVLGGAQLVCSRPGGLAASGRQRSVVTQAKVGDQNPVSGKFDYVIVGGGAAGCVLANRLTEDGTKRVLVLEAGCENNSRDVKIPAGLTRLFKSALDWNLYTRPQEALDDRKVYQARGKLLGGSSSTNATLYHRGAAADYDAWGIAGWSSKDVLDWFVRCEDNSRGAAPGVHGVGGTMHVENPRYENKLHDVFFQAAEQQGLSANQDFNDWNHPQAGYGEFQAGYGEFQVTQERGERADMFRQYLKPALARDNLQVLTGAKTLSVEFEKHGDTPVARGVVFSYTGPDGGHHTAELNASGEVLMCAGAVHTPQILQLSGVGPAKQLQQHGIDVVADLGAVGSNMQDHPACLTAFHAKEEVGAIAITDEIYHKSGRLRTRAMLNYFLRRKGPLTTTGCDHGAFVSTAGQSQPDLQIRFVPGEALDPDGISSYVTFSKLKETGLKWPTGITYQLLAIRPQSRGSIGLKTADPFDSPLIDTAFCSDPEGADMATLRAGVRLTRELSKTPAFQPIVQSETWPGADKEDDASIDAYIRETLHSGNAIVGTCRMGASDRDAVVDSQLRVFGTRGLRVIDASVIPVIPGGQTGAATVMVAERAAAILRGSAQDAPAASAGRVTAAIAA
ncbi:hypothetical protein WJX72_002610 [[Myrmecia] bisecta]|uniref:Glucose-methanol-choline oxidoreductase N-terminal domain-containing protein n=1 Tax=[Myrmecia] bisecta TaxID=41462 RepID=A0AAW1P9M4_9CHLO